jgi:tetratricopeptide (TPR) repeat protein
MAIDMDDIRYKAGSAVDALANRAVSKGRVEPGGKRKAGWVENVDGSWIIDPEKYREAIAYYEIAASITPEGPNRAFSIYQKALLLEDMGDFAEAETTYLSLEGSAYGDPGRRGATRCSAKRKGTYDMKTEANAVFAQLADRVRGTGGDASGLDKMRETFDKAFAFLATAKPQPVDATATKPDDDKSASAETQPDDDEEVAATALRFVNLLLDRNYSDAKAMLHSTLSATRAADLKAAFEPLFEGEDFPQSANVFDVDPEWTDLRAGDIAWVYVTIDSENAEAVSVIVARENDTLVIRNIEWGRP